MEQQERSMLKTKKRIVIKIGSSSLTHPETGDLNLIKIEKLGRPGGSPGILRSDCRRPSGTGPSEKA